MLATLFGAIIGNIRVVMYLGVAIIIATFGYKMYSIIKENGRYESQIEILKATNENKDKQIKALEELVKITDQVIKSKDQEIAEYEQTVKGITQDLGEDAKDPAADSIKEYFKRLSQ